MPKANEICAIDRLLRTLLCSNVISGPSVAIGSCPGEAILAVAGGATDDDDAMLLEAEGEDDDAVSTAGALTSSDTG